MSDIKGTLSICRRAGKLIGGMDEVKASVRRREARLVLVTRDTSEKSREEIAFECKRYNIALEDIPETMFEIAESVGKRFGVMSVTDRGFAESIIKKLSNEQSK